MGVIAAIDAANNTIKVKLANLVQEFNQSEAIHSNIISIAGTANGSLNTTSLPFQANTMTGNTTVAITTISAISPSTFMAEKNAFTQNPIVRLYSIYYPGEWYPPNENGNPTGQGEGRAWPNDFPIRFAEIVGDIADDISYNVSYAGTSYIPFPVTVSGLDQGSDGKINELSMSVYNVDNIISHLIEDPYLTGNNISNSVVAYVNNEYVHGIDPRTVSANPSDVGTVGEEAYDSLLRARSNGLSYNSAYVDFYGTANASFNKTTTLEVGGTWQAHKKDTRDLLGGVVEIKTTFANFLDYWPEYSLATRVSANTITVKNSLPYRVGDNVRSSTDTIEATILSIDSNDIILSNPINATNTAAIYIINDGADSESFLEDKFKIDQLEGLSEHVASFGLVSWLQYFKIVTPKRKYYKNTCQWLYKGAECQYPGPGGLSIPGTTLLSNTHPIAANNSIADSVQGDVCSKSLAACTLRNNSLHFGGFPGVGRTIPRA